MAKHFITFTGYYQPDKPPMFWPAEETGPKFPGKEVLFSNDERLNRFCGYREKNLHDCKNFADIMRETAEFMAEFEFDIGVAIDEFDGDRVTEVLTERAHLNAYGEYGDEVSLLVLFNARPVKVGRNNVIIGNDIYGLEHAKHSVIVWDAERYIDVLPSDYTIWGIKQNTGRRLSETDDVMIGLRGGEILYARG